MVLMIPLALITRTCSPGLHYSLRSAARSVAIITSTLNAVDKETKDYLDALMAWDDAKAEEMHAAKMAELPKQRHAVFYSLV